MTDFLFIYELKVRELESVVLIGNEMERRGYTVEYCNFPYWDLMGLRKKYYKKVRCIIVQSMYNEKVFYNLVYSLVGSIGKVINLQWEQVNTERTEKDRNYYAYPKNIALEVPHICWGKIPQNNLVSAGMKEKKAPLVGPVQMDLLRDNFRNYYRSRNEIFSEFQINSAHTTILFISSFSYASLTDEEAGTLQKKLGDTEVKNFREISIKSQKRFLEWVRCLLEREKKINFIYRPHPAEYRNSELVEMEKKYSQFKCIKDFSVKQWILICDKVYTWYSTSIAECYFSGVPYMVVRPYFIPEEDDVSTMRGLKFITTCDEFIKSLADSNTQKNDVQIKDYYDFNDSIPSYIRIADFLEKVITLDEYDTEIPENLEKQYKKKICYDIIIAHIVKLYEKFMDCLVKLYRKRNINMPQVLQHRVEKHLRMKIKIAENQYSEKELANLKISLLKLAIQGEKR